MTIVKHFLHVPVSGEQNMQCVCVSVASILGKKKEEVESMSAKECLKTYREAFREYSEDKGSIEGNRVVLSQAIKTAEGAVESLELKEPSMKNVMDFPMEKATFGDFLVVCSEVTGIQVGFLKKMSLCDARNVIVVLVRFLFDGLLTGERP